MAKRLFEVVRGFIMIVGTATIFYIGVIVLLLELCPILEKIPQKDDDEDFVDPDIDSENFYDS